MALLVLSVAGAGGRALLFFHLMDRGASTFTVGLMLTAFVLRTRKETANPSSAASLVEESTQRLWSLATASAAVWLVAAVGHFWAEYEAQPLQDASRPLAVYATVDWQGKFLALQLVLVVVDGNEVHSRDPCRGARSSATRGDVAWVLQE